MSAKQSVRGSVSGGAERKGPARAEPETSQEPTSQFTLKMRASLHRELTVLAFESGMTMRGFVMNALKEKGLDVSDEDLIDRRRR